MPKPYSKVGNRLSGLSQERQIVIHSGDRQHWGLVIISSLSLIAAPITAAIITSNSNQSDTNKDYVALAVNILDSKTSTDENRKWATKLLARLSPVPFTEVSEQQLNNGSGISVGPVWGPRNPLIKKGKEEIRPCLPVNGPNKKVWSDKDHSAYTAALSAAYAKCASKQQYAVRVVDILQNTYKTDASILYVGKPMTYATTIVQPRSR